MGKLNDNLSLAASVVRLGRGWIALHRSRESEPEQMLELFEFEG